MTDNIEFMLGQALARLDELQRDNQEASQSRKVLYERMDRMSGDIRIVSGQLEQVRNKHDALAKQMADEVMPTVAIMKTLQRDGRNWLMVAGLAGTAISTAVGGLIYGNWNAIWSWVKNTF